nr:hypothetical protein [Sinorhizobium sp. NFACC03]
MSQLADGDTTIGGVGRNRKDEIGDMARSVLVFRDALLDRARLETEAARYDPVRGVAPDQRGRRDAGVGPRTVVARRPDRTHRPTLRRRFRPSALGLQSVAGKPCRHAWRREGEKR